jgi:hypothetical protein
MIRLAERARHSPGQLIPSVEGPWVSGWSPLAHLPSGTHGSAVESVYGGFLSEWGH